MFILVNNFFNFVQNQNDLFFYFLLCSHSKILINFSRFLFFTCKKFLKNIICEKCKSNNVIRYSLYCFCSKFLSNDFKFLEFELARSISDAIDLYMMIFYFTYNFVWFCFRAKASCFFHIFFIQFLQEIEILSVSKMFNLYEGWLCITEIWVKCSWFDRKIRNIINF